MGTLKIALVIGLPFSAIAAVMAYVITLDEYSHHFAEKSKAIHPALGTAFFTFLFFVILTVILAFLLPYVV
jgi:hypothetical protein